MKSTGKKSTSRIAVMLLLIDVLALALNLEIFLGYGTESVWNMTYGGGNEDVARSVQQTSDGGYIVAGFTQSFGAVLADFWLVKANASGSMQWNRMYGGAGVDEAYWVRQTSDEGYIVAGFTQSFGSGSADFWLIKTDANGARQWNKTYGGTSDDRAFCVQNTSDGGYIAAGFRESLEAGGRDFWVVKTDSAGDQQWNKTYGGAGLEQAFSAVQTSDGGYAIVGETTSSGAGSSDFWVVKTDSVGNVLWSRAYGGTSLDVARSVQQVSDGGYIIAGWTTSFGDGGSDFWLIKTDNLGNTQWNKTYGGLSDDEAYSVQQTTDGGYIIAGGTKSFGIYAGSWEFWLVKTDSNGIMQRDQANGGSADDQAYSLQQTRDGGYIVAGYTKSFGEGLSDFWLNKLGPGLEKPPEEPPPEPPPDPVEPILGDINSDGKVDELDLERLNEAYGSSPGRYAFWDQNADINGDNIVNVFDLFILGQNYGQGSG